MIFPFLKKIWFWGILGPTKHGGNHASPLIRDLCSKGVSLILALKFSNWRPLLEFTFSQGFRISQKFGHWTLGSGGSKTVNQSEQSVTDRQTYKTQNSS